MKERHGFVSNSSSSSFIVPIMNSIEDVNYESLQRYFKASEVACWGDRTRKAYSITLPVESDIHRFGWEEETHGSFVNKLNYLVIQIENLRNVELHSVLKSKLREALENICQKAYRESSVFSFNVLIDYNKLKWDSIYDCDEFYNIDHQSAWYESEEYVLDYFKDHTPDAALIENYLVGDSYIQGGNDNEEMSSFYYESSDILEKYKNEQQKAVD